MKKKHTILLVILFLSVMTGKAQWLSNGTNIYFNAGKLGIGKIPTGIEKFQVLGDTKLEGTLNVTGSVIFSGGLYLSKHAQVLNLGAGSSSGNGYHLNVIAGSDSYVGGNLRLLGGASEFYIGGDVFVEGGEGMSDDSDPQGSIGAQGGSVRIKAGNSMMDPGNIFIDPGYGDKLNMGNIRQYGTIYLAQNGGKFLIGSSASSSPVNMELTHGSLKLNSGNLDITNGNCQIHDGSKLQFVNSENSFTIDRAFGNLYFRSSGSSAILVLKQDGSVGIGTSIPDAKLAVKGKIHAQEVRVDLQGAVTPDYVFDEDYELKTLEEVEDYIRKEHHLPEIPSANEMEENGMNLKEMNLLLLKKVEELTLHLIEQNKTNKENQKKIELLAAELEKQKNN